ncbi:MAG: 30S ribosomal protein S17 [Planctomycetota bacterium]
MTAHDRKTVRGTVVSDSMDKTIIVRSERLVPHPRYKKLLRSFTKYYAHDEKNSAKVGDIVDLVGARPLSKTKRWRLLEVVTRSSGYVEGGT